MCDWEEKEYAEYLLWQEAARAKVRVPRNERMSSHERAENWLSSPTPVAAAET